MLRLMAKKRVLLLQGPMGPFFHRLAQDLRTVAAAVFKINFCAGDEFFYPRHAIRFAQPFDDWPRFLAEFVQANQVDTVVLFGDCRPLHAAATEVCRSMGVSVHVFEEGYLRPDFVTIESGGANGFSPMPRDVEEYRQFQANKAAAVKPQRVRRVFRWAAVYASLYCVAMALGARRYPHYRHHRPLRPGNEIKAWLRAGMRKLLYQWRERHLLARLSRVESGNYFLVPLQVQGDAQIACHSPFNSVAQFLETVIASFRAHAPEKHLLVIKHHPLDRGYNDYRGLIDELVVRHGVEARVLYVHDLHLPLLLRRARGTVVINSTVGLSSVHHGTPVCVLGDAPYRLPGLTYQGALDDFWRDPGKPDADLYRRFRSWMRAHNQANGNFYVRLDGVGTRTGLRWPDRLPDYATRDKPADREQPAWAVPDRASAA